MRVRSCSGSIQQSGRRQMSGRPGAGPSVGRRISLGIARPSWGILAALLTVVGVGLSGCGGEGNKPLVFENNPPVIGGFFLNPERAHAAEDVAITVTAEDPDGDPMIYRWFTTRGSFPFGRGQRAVIWRTPRTRGVDTISVIVSDSKDTVTARKVIALILPTPPGAVAQVNSTSLVDLSWEPSTDQGIENWAGYEVFMADRSLLGTPDDQIGKYSITPDLLSDRRFRVSGLAQGRRYYFHVRAVRRYDAIAERSGPTLEVDMSPRPEGPVSGFGEFSSTARLAFDLSAGRVRPFDPADPSGIELLDFYIGTTNDLDQGGPLVLKSISELANRDARWSERVVQVKPLGDDNWSVSTTDDSGWSTQAPIDHLAVYAIKTPEGNFAKVQITGITRFAPDRLATLIWAYQPIPNYASF